MRERAARFSLPAFGILFDSDCVRFWTEQLAYAAGKMTRIAINTKFLRHGSGLSSEFTALGTSGLAQTTNIAMPAPNMAMVAIATTIHPRRELGWPCINFLSAATIRIATIKNGASNPLMTAVQ